MKAITTKGDSDISLQSASVPKPDPHQILVRVVTIAVNPIDRKKLVLVSKANIKDEIICGCDFTGYVEEIGSSVEPHLRRKGERVAGFIHGGISTEFGGTFAEYCVADASLVVSLPDDLSFENAASLGISGFTAMQIVFQKQPETSPFSPLAQPKPLLVWGGASSLGMYTIQLAKLAGYNVIATASPKNFDLVKAYGASSVFDYRDQDVAPKIREHTNDGLVFAIDTISEAYTLPLVVQSIGSQGGFVSTVSKAAEANREALRQDVAINFHLCFMLLGKAFHIPARVGVVAGFRDAGITYANQLTQLLADKKLKTPPIRVIPNGLGGVNDALTQLAEGKVSGEKLVLRVAETPEAS
ncbi:GroES-like protein [Sistotremastrum suecicum HHB10207 ss-3]|uniref:GroES-like protein n=1 Tax=Sistotremastrum suecicum HHB10207 ss-3 TaxID=1314776 RepID=A0A166HAU7_9AGAM|nr:GroES-like protein [Sistotremastrum suecicum HHB10207 ss-3]